MLWEHVVYYMAHEPLKAGDLCIIIEDEEIRKIDRKKEIPDVLVVHHPMKDGSYVSGEIVPTKWLWYDDRLTVVLEIGGVKYYPGERREDIMSCMR